MTENAFRIFLIVVSLVQIAISARYIKAARAGATIFQRREEGMALSLLIVVFYLAYVVVFIVYLINPQWLTGFQFDVPVPLRWLGAIPLLLGAKMMHSGLRHLGKSLTISISTRADHKLIDSGPYRYVRHPLYTAGMIQSIGLCLLMANWLVAVFAGGFWVLIVFRTPMEEEKLSEQFGDQYREYAKRVGRFWPRRRRKCGES